MNSDLIDIRTVLLLDINLPDMDSYEVARLLRVVAAMLARTGSSCTKHL